MYMNRIAGIFSWAADGDGLEDKEDPMPVLHQGMYYFVMVLAGVAGVASVVMGGVNKYSAEKIIGRRMKYESTLDKAADRMETERDDRGKFRVTQSVIPTADPEYFKVKLTMEVIDRTFFGLSCRINYSAGAQEFQKVNARKLNEDLYEFTLEKIPVDTRVLYSLEFLDRGGEWVVDDNNGTFYTFATNADGTIDTHHEDEWQVDRSFKCEVCGYMCLPEWDTCPNCNTPLHEDLTGELLLDEQQKKAAVQHRERDAEAIAWAEAQETDEVWRGLPSCPECGMSVQPEWAKCPVCSLDLTQYQLEKGAVYGSLEIDMDYIEGKEEEEIETEYESDIEEVKSQKELLDEMEKQEEKKKKDAWNVDVDDNMDIL